jgi:hypothetical protein
MARYYPTCTRLPDGRILVNAGDYWDDDDGDGVIDTTPPPSETKQHLKAWLIYDPAATTKWSVGGAGFNVPLSGVVTDYPRVKVLPIGLFWSGDELNSQLQSYATSHLWWPLESWANTPSDITSSRGPNHPSGSKNRERATCNVLMLNAKSDDVSILLVGGGDSGALQQLGGQEAQGITCTFNSATNTVSGPASWTGVDMISNGSRRDANTVLLPNGRVFSSGHETADSEGRNYQIYYPPYLFNGNSWAVRDTIETWPASVPYGLSFEITGHHGSLRGSSAMRSVEPGLHRPRCLSLCSRQHARMRSDRSARHRMRTGLGGGGVLGQGQESVPVGGQDMRWNGKCAAEAGALALLLLIPRATWAAETRFALTGAAVINDRAGSSRVLLDFGDLNRALAGELVTSAVLEIQLPGTMPDTTIAVEVSAVQTAWVGRAPAWTTPWGPCRRRCRRRAIGSRTPGQGALRCEPDLRCHRR